MIEIVNVHKSFGDLEVVKGVSLTVNKGEVVSIIGGSGSGKSTLLMCINGLEPIQKGHIRVAVILEVAGLERLDRKSTRLNSSHVF